MPNYENLITRRYLSSRGQYSFFAFTVMLSITGIALGVAALVIVMAVMNGFTAEMQNRILAVNAHAVLLRYTGGFENYDEVLEKVQHAEGVKAAAPFIYNQAMLTAVGGAKGAVIRGLRPQEAFSIGELRTHLEHGSGPLTEEQLFALAPSEDDADIMLPSMLLGIKLAENLGVEAGDEVNVVSPIGQRTSLGVSPRIKRFKVSGVFDSGFFEYDNSLSYINMADAQEFFKMDGVITGIEIAVHDINAANLIADRLETELGYPYWVRDWKELNHNLFTALATEKYVMFLLICVIIAVAAFNIISSMIMLVVEKKQEIGILRAMGVPSAGIGRIFVRLGLIVGLFGTGIGSLLGIGICLFTDHFELISLPPDVYFISSFPIRPDLVSLGAIATAALVITLVFTLIPARMAARTLPAEALRYD
jgi:lipoprotein-releasing system permease protein